MRQVVIHRFMKSGFKLINAAAVKANNVADTRQVTDKNTVLLVKLNTGAVALVGHGVHGVIPIASKNRRASNTRYLKASRCGCGR